MLAFVLISLNMFGQVQEIFELLLPLNGNWNDTLQWETYNGSSWLAGFYNTGSAAKFKFTIRNGAVINFNSLPANPILNLTVGEEQAGS